MLNACFRLHLPFLTSNITHRCAKLPKPIISRTNRTNLLAQKALSQNPAVPRQRNCSSMVSWKPTWENEFLGLTTQEMNEAPFNLTTEMHRCFLEGDIQKIQEIKKKITRFLPIYFKECAQPNRIVFGQLMRDGTKELWLELFEIFVGKFGKDPDKLKTISEYLTDFRDLGLKNEEIFKALNFTDHELFEAALIFAEKNPDFVSKNLKKFALDEENKLFEIAKTIVKKGHIEYLQNFVQAGLRSPEKIVKIVLMGIRESYDIPDKVIKNIKDWGLNEDQLYEIANRAATLRSSISYSISDYQAAGLKNSEKLYQLALIEAVNYPYKLSNSLDDYGFIEEEKLFDIARILANRGILFCYIMQYVQAGLKDPEKLFELALIDVAKNSNAIIGMKNYNVGEEAKLFPIAKILSGKGALAQSIKIFRDAGLNDPDLLYRLALMEAKNNFESLSKHLSGFGIREPDKLFWIARTAAYNGSKLSGQIEYFVTAGLKNPEMLFDLAQIILEIEGIDALFQCTESLLEGGLTHDGFIKITKKIEINPFYSIPWLYLNENLKQGTQGEAASESFDYTRYIEKIKLYAKVIWKGNLRLEEELDTIAKTPNLFVKKALLFWMIKFLPSYQNLNLTPEQHLEIKPLINNLLRYPDPAMRDNLSQLVYKLAKPEFFQGWKSLKNTLKTTADNKKKYSLLPHLLLAELYSTEPDVCKFVIERFFSCPASDKGESKRSLVNFLNYLTQDAILSPTEKIQILNTIFQDKYFNLVKLQAEIPPEQKGGMLSKKDAEVLRSAHFEKILKTMRIVEDLLTFEQHDQLKQISDIDAFSGVMEKLFVKEFGSKINHFTDKYMQTFGTFRQKNAVLTYLGRLKTLPSPKKEEALNLLNSFVAQVLNGAFKEMRYDLSKNSHLKRFFGNDIALLEKWKKGESLSANYFKVEGTSTNPMKGAVNLGSLKASEPQKARKNWEEKIVVDSDDPCDLLLMGTEVRSCLSVDGDPAFNADLLEYLLDGGIRLIAVKNPSGTIKGRCLLYISDKQGKVALIQGRMYPSRMDAETEQLLNRMCLMRAEDLGLSLVDEDGFRL